MAEFFMLLTESNTQPTEKTRELFAALAAVPYLDWNGSFGTKTNVGTQDPQGGSVTATTRQGFEFFPWSADEDLLSVINPAGLPQWTHTDDWKFFKEAPDEAFTHNAVPSGS